MLTDAEIDVIVSRIAERAKPEQIYVFGSHAKGTATARSDLDLLVVLDSPLPMAQRADEITALFPSSLIPLDIHVYTPEEVSELGREEHSLIHSVLTTGRRAFPPPGPPGVDSAGPLEKEDPHRATAPKGLPPWAAPAEPTTGADDLPGGADHRRSLEIGRGGG